MQMGYHSALSNLGITMENQEGVTISAPLYLVSATQPCNLCGKENKIVALATQHLVDEFEPEDDDGFLLCYAEELPEEILAEVLQRQPSFQKRDSLTAGGDLFHVDLRMRWPLRRPLRTKAVAKPDGLQAIRGICRATAGHRGLGCSVRLQPKHGCWGISGKSSAISPGRQRLAVALPQ